MRGSNGSCTMSLCSTGHSILCVRSSQEECRVASNNGTCKTAAAVAQQLLMEVPGGCGLLRWLELLSV